LINLNNQVSNEGKIDKIIGRKKEVERLSSNLIQKNIKIIPLLVGESGVGKTAIAEGLAYLIIQ